MADEAKPEKLTLGEALKDLGWFPIMFAVGVGGPSILAIIECVLVNHQLVPALQWIVEGYNRIMAVLGAAVEPLVQPAIDWVNARFGWTLELDPVWRPMFALGMIFPVADLRSSRAKGVPQNQGVPWNTLTRSFHYAVVALFVALLAGLLEATWNNSDMGPIAFAFFIGWLSTTVPILVLRATGRKIGRRAIFGPIFFSFGSGLSILFSRYFGISEIAGPLAAMIFLGVLFVQSGFEEPSRKDTRFGLTILGGFVAAGLILAADWGLKGLGAG